MRIDRGPSREDIGLVDSRSITRGVHGFSRQDLECAR